MRWLALWAALAGPTVAQEVAPDPAIYTCHVYVTGSDTRNRPAALERCVRDVLVKLSGDPALVDDPGAGLGERSAGLVEDFVYLDLMSDIPTHDEQGTRDRPFELVGHVSPTGAAAVLRELGRTAWTEPRPRLEVNVTVVRDAQSHEMTVDDERDERMRRALLAAAEQFGMRVVVRPIESMTGSRILTLSTVPTGQAPVTSSSYLLFGRLTWSDAEFGWVADWTLSTGPRPAAWQIRGVSFDAAFRAGIGGAAERIAGR